MYQPDVPVPVPVTEMVTSPVLALLVAVYCLRLLRSGVIIGVVSGAALVVV